jgi:hypothetical protein
VDKGQLRRRGFGFYDVSPAGQRFVMIEKDPFELRPLGLVIIPNWTAELQADGCGRARTPVNSKAAA